MAATSITSTSKPAGTGSCLCGGVKFEMTSEPSKKVLCHCRNCRKATGSCFMANEWYQKSDFHITHGENTVKTYHDDQTTSGNPLDRSFCGNCGSPVFVTDAKAEDIVLVTVGTQDKVGDWYPQEELYYAKRMSWLPKIEGSKAVS